MTKTEIFNELKKIYIEIAGKSKTKNISAKSNLVHDLGMMSISFVYMSFLIEKKFNVSMEDISFSSFKTVGDVIDYIAKML